jgi:hypothetical protein
MNFIKSSREKSKYFHENVQYTCTLVVMQNGDFTSNDKLADN